MPAWSMKSAGGNIDQIKAMGPTEVDSSGKTYRISISCKTGNPDRVSSRLTQCCTKPKLMIVKSRKLSGRRGQSGRGCKRTDSQSVRENIHASRKRGFSLFHRGDWWVPTYKLQPHPVYLFLAHRVRFPGKPSMSTGNSAWTSIRWHY